MTTLLVKIYIEHDDHNEGNKEVFRVCKERKLLIEPQKGHIIEVDCQNFYVGRIKQNLDKGIVCLYENTFIPHYEFWGKHDQFKEKYLPKLLEEGWTEM